MIYIDYFALAKDILISIEEEHPTVVLTEQGEDVTSIANLLENYIEPDLVFELMTTNIGLGMLAGMISMLYSEYGEPPKNEKGNMDKDRQH